MKDTLFLLLDSFTNESSALASKRAEAEKIMGLGQAQTSSSALKLEL